jgi:hypothetical protein
LVRIFFSRSSPRQKTAKTTKKEEGLERTLTLVQIVQQFQVLGKLSRSRSLSKYWKITWPLFICNSNTNQWYDFPPANQIEIISAKIRTLSKNSLHISGHLHTATQFAMRRHVIQHLRRHGVRSTTVRNHGFASTAPSFHRSSSNSSSNNSNSNNNSTVPARAFTTTAFTQAQDKEEDAPAATSSSSTTHTFEAETTQLLDIVINSLYTDKEVFLRELVSNAADALEKLRYVQTAQSDMKIIDPLVELGITITIDQEASPRTITIQDTGIGMSKEQMIENLGTIARSGSKAFLQENQEEGAVDIIGKFGVGFYAAFMVASKISVTSRSADAGVDGPAHVWTSEGVGSYDIAAATEADIPRGTKIVLELREENNEFAEEGRLQSILKTYSNFVPFPIELAGNRVNTVQAIWASTPSDVTEEQYNEFYRYVGNAFDDPLYKLHFRADVPLDLKALFFVPTMHSEKYGMERMETGVSLYSKKVLIDSKPEKLLPDWLRFVQGVVDSEDLPLNISRESMQDTALIAKIGGVLTRRFMRLLEDESKKDSEKYNEFFLEFGHFLKEGVVTDFANKNNIAKLLRFESSARAKEEDALSSFDDYISRCPVEQNTIYYLCAPSRLLGKCDGVMVYMYCGRIFWFLLFFVFVFVFLKCADKVDLSRFDALVLFHVLCLSFHSFKRNNRPIMKYLKEIKQRSCFYTHPLMNLSWAILLNTMEENWCLLKRVALI